jgi:two-component system, OmpR family, sensor histidine kinase BaeS
MGSVTGSPGNKAMRSITFKALLSFLVISMVSILLIVLSIRWLTEKEFQTYLTDQNQTNIVSTLAEFYGANGTWTGVEGSLLVPMVQPPPQGNQGGRWFFTLVDSNNVVVIAGPGDTLGTTLPSTEVAKGVPVTVNGVTVGTMLTRQPPNIKINPAESAFLNKIKQYYLLIAIGVILLAVLLAFLFSRMLTRPIRELTAATRAVSAGKLTQTVPVRSRDELGELAASFNQMNAELARSTELRRQMTADIAHELRTPVSVILGHAEAVHDGLLAPSLETFEIIRDETARLECLIEDLRTLSRADAGELPMEMRLFDVAKLLENVCLVHNQRAAQKRITITAQTTPGLPMVSMDPGRMTQVLNNLVDNALRYTLEGGSIFLSANFVDGMLEIRTQDSGAGIPAAELNRVFDRFYRSDPSRQREQGGSGLGLAIARSIIEKHNGSIWAESQQGQGTTIVIHLPLVD